MAEPTTLARPYARAAFEAARNADQLGLWLEQLTVAGAVASDPKIVQLLGSPSYSPERKAAALADVIGGERPDGFHNLLAVLAENDRLILLPQICELFAAFKAEQERSIAVELVSAFPMDEDWQRKLTEALGRKLNRDIVLTTQVDESLLGGAIIRAGDTVIDGSVKGRLARLNTALQA